jgi:hypothetical protein
MLQFIGCTFLIGIFAGLLFIFVKFGFMVAIIILAILMVLGFFSKSN